MKLQSTVLFWGVNATILYVKNYFAACMMFYWIFSFTRVFLAIDVICQLLKKYYESKNIFKNMWKWEKHWAEIIFFFKTKPFISIVTSFFQENIQTFVRVNKLCSDCTFSGAFPFQKTADNAHLRRAKGIPSFNWRDMMMTMWRIKLS